MVRKQKQASANRQYAAGDPRGITYPGSIIQGIQDVHMPTDSGGGMNREFAEELDVDLDVMHSYQIRRGVIGFLTNIHATRVKISNTVANALQFNRIRTVMCVSVYPAQVLNQAVESEPRNLAMIIIQSLLSAR